MSAKGFQYLLVILTIPPYLLASKLVTSICYEKQVKPYTQINNTRTTLADSI